MFTTGPAAPGAPARTPLPCVRAGPAAKEYVMHQRETRNPPLLRYRRRTHLPCSLLLLSSLGARLAIAGEEEGSLLAAGDGSWHQRAALDTDDNRRAPDGGKVLEDVWN